MTWSLHFLIPTWFCFGVFFSLFNDEWNGEPCYQTRLFLFFSLNDTFFFSYKFDSECLCYPDFTLLLLKHVFFHLFWSINLCPWSSQKTERFKVWKLWAFQKSVQKIFLHCGINKEHLIMQHLKDGISVIKGQLNNVCPVVCCLLALYLKPLWCRSLVWSFVFCVLLWKF